MVTDVLLRLNLPMSALRGQSYDGGSNMAGKYSGAQAVVREQQPLALYVHCGAHCVNLIIQAGCSVSPMIWDCLSLVHQLGILFNQSGKFKRIFANIVTSENEPITTLKPLCPTRWTVRNSAIIAVLGQYERVLVSLEEMAKSASRTASTASGRSYLQGKRNDKSYLELFEKATSLVNSIELVDPIETANSRRFAGKAVDHYRAEFFKVLDCVEVQFGERFNQDSLKSLRSLENVLLTGLLTDSVDKYPSCTEVLLQYSCLSFTRNSPVAAVERQQRS
ncbi:zinc finger MYM-type protein 1-like [Tachysurus fulvidraco]|uniref:zinc finger MYM-type protein 1-like n=1 Tax=Tachysurus fulvidraco TaxID=1234273 RepID=UPI001FEDA142|nr:zinc finger MYM-type protein 1-like [Tachysurus fulvidraco]XP_047670249.1 zinc finger MYM-type protein 1-like [Tachysurus fulvidraco]